MVKILTKILVLVLSFIGLAANAQSCTFYYGTVIDYNNELICPGNTPFQIGFESLPSGGSYTVQWYYATGLVTCPTGSSTAGWTLLPGATNVIFSPVPITQDITYACYVTPVNVPNCTPQWANSCDRIQILAPGMVNFGTIENADQLITPAVNSPDTIEFSIPVSAPNPITNFIYKWYYKEGIVAAPTGSSTNGWILATDGTNINSGQKHLPPANLTTTRTYACFVRVLWSTCGPSQWSNNCRHITIVSPPSINFGVIESDRDTLFNNCPVPDTIRFITLPSGFIGNFNYKWYRCIGDCDCPADNINSTQTQWLGVANATNNFLVVTPGMTTAIETYACFVTADTLSGVYSGLSSFAQGCKVIAKFDVGFTSGHLLEQDQDPTCSPFDPGLLSFEIAPAVAFDQQYTLQWYYKDGFNTCPTEDDDGTGWTLIPGANSLSYDPPANLNISRTYVCRVDKSPNYSGCVFKWTDCIQKAVTTVVDYGTVESGIDTICGNYISPTIYFTSPPSSNGNATFDYQWYYQPGITGCPTGNSTTGWFPQAYGYNLAYGGLNGDYFSETRTYACMVIPESVDGGCSPQWAASCKSFVVGAPVTFNPGSIPSITLHGCSEVDPPPITFDVLPSGGSGNYLYHWVSGPTMYTMDCAGWSAPTNNPGTTSPIFDPVPYYFNPQTYRCYVEDIGNPDCIVGAYADGCYATFFEGQINYGTVNSVEDTVCPGYDPPIITFDELPAGYGYTTYNYQWYYKVAITNCPLQGANLSGWVLISGATSSTYDPPALTTGRMFACRVTPIGSNNCNLSPTEDWATNCVKYTMTTFPLSYGTVASANHNICSGGIANTLSFSAAPTGTGTSTYSYQWCYQDGIVSAPSGSSTTGWIPVPNATTATYTPTEPLYNSRTYACLVSTVEPLGGCFQSAWANGCRQVTLITPSNINYGTIISGVDSFCTTPQTIYFTTPPSNGTTGNYSYQWYYLNWTSCPAPGSNTDGWVPVTINGTNNYYSPQAYNNRTFACYVTDATPGCGSAWADGCKTILNMNFGVSSAMIETRTLTLCYYEDPEPISIYSYLTIDTVKYDYQWYYSVTDNCTSTSTSTIGSVLIPGATSISYDPDVNSPSGYYKCFITPKYCGVGNFVSGCVRILRYGIPIYDVYYGRLAEGDESICTGGDPSCVFFSNLPTTTQDTTSYQNIPSKFRWYYKNGINATPTGTSTVGWTPVSEADSAFYSYDPPAGLTQNRTYACQTALQSVGYTCLGWAWAGNSRQVYITGQNTVSYGTVNNNNEVLCLGMDSTNANPSPIQFSTLPSGAGQFTYQWYYKNGQVAAPTGSNTAGWTLIENANASTYNPLPPLSVARTYACFITPIYNTGCPIQSQWAGSCSYVSFLANAPVYYGNIGTIADDFMCGTSTEYVPSISFMQTPNGGSGTFSYQWYYKSSIVACPTGSSTNGWTAISGATSATLPANTYSYSTSVTIACFVTPTSISGCVLTAGWANGCYTRPNNTLYTPASFGTLTSVNQTICSGGEIPQPIGFSTLPSGGLSYSYHWYYQNNLTSQCPTPGAYLWSSDISIGVTNTPTLQLPAQVSSMTVGCMVTINYGPNCSVTAYAGGCNRITVQPVSVTYGTITSITDSICPLGNPAPIALSTLPTGANSYTYKWYFQSGTACPQYTPSSLTGWTPIFGSNSSTYDPPAGLTTSRIYICTATPNDEPCQTNYGVATGCRVVIIKPNVALNYGTLATLNQSICAGGDPANIAFSTAPSGGGGTFSYQWYYKDGDANCPSGINTTGWTLINGATSNSYDPPTGLLQSRTYSCYVTSSSNGCSLNPGWASNCRKVIISPNINRYFGQLSTPDQTYCTASADPPNLTFLYPPSGGGGVFSYQWYYQDGLADCPTGSSTVGWTLISGATNASYNPPSGLTNNRTYACLVTDASSNGCPGASGWAADCRKTTIVPPVVLNYGTLAVGDEAFCGIADPSPIAFAIPPSGGSGTYLYQWYYKSGLVACPTGTSTNGWTIIANATSATYNPPSGLMASRTYACFVGESNNTTCTFSGWASQCRQVTMSLPIVLGTITYNNQVLCPGNNPAQISFSTQPSGGSGNFTYQWYSTEGDFSCPADGLATGWNIINGATGNTYDPPPITSAISSYACFVTALPGNGCAGLSGWATGCRKFSVAPASSFGTITMADEEFCTNANPSNITFSSAPSVSSGTVAYQWYYQDGVLSCPTGSSTSGWTLISNATSSTYDPTTILQNRTYACYVTITQTGCTAVSNWANGCRKITITPNPIINYGTLSSNSESFCNTGNPASIIFTISPTGGVNSFSRQWYYQDGIVAAPTGSSTAGWTLISGATGTSYDPPAGLTNSRTYACLVTPLPTQGCTMISGWANGCRQITINNMATLNFGTLASGNESFCGSGNPSPIYFDVLPSGGGGIFTYLWYYQDDIVSCPTGSSTTGWILVPGAISNSFDPPTWLNTNRTYACLVTDAGGQGCATSTQWANSCRQITYSSGASFGTLVNADETFCNTGNPSIISFTNAPFGGNNITYQWYYQNGLTTCPTGSSTGGWTIINGATANSYDPPSGLLTNRTYACFVSLGQSNCGSGLGWATQCRQVTITNNPTINYGTLTAGNESFCGSGDPGNIIFATSPSGGGGTITYQWYYQNGIVTCPTGSSTTNWISIGGATFATYDAPSGLSQSRTYACMVTVSGTCVSGSAWATQCRQVTITPAVAFGTLVSSNEGFCSSGNPAMISFATTPSGGSGSYIYQWYFQDGLITCPTGSSTSSWTVISGETALTYDPPAGLTQSRTYACLVTSAAGLGCAATTGWATQCRQVTITPGATFGTLATANESICSPGDPSNIVFTITPTGGSGNFTYQWYYQDGLITCPTGSSTSGWTAINGATATTYDAPSGLTQSRTYACLVTASAGNGCTTTTGWATQCRQVTIALAANFGTLISANETICSNGDPSAISFATIPSGGSGNYTYQWYYQDGLVTCPTGSSTSGWTIISGATVNMYDPPMGLTTSRTYACLVTATAGQGCAATTGWATLCRQVTITVNPIINYGTLATGNETLCTSGDPGNIIFATPPSGGGGTFTYQWYYQNGLITCPTGSSIVGWTSISGATASNYDAPSGLTQSRTYACMVTVSGSCISVNSWATQCRLVTITPAATFGTLTNSNESFCGTGDPSNITFATTPSGGSGSYTYQWYYQDGLITCPTGSSTTGWTSINGATAAAYDAPSGLTTNRTYACLVTATAGLGCTATTGWATQCRQVTITPTATFGSLTSAHETFCITADPSNIIFTTTPSGGSGNYTYQWYYKDGLITCPTGSSTTGWTIISGATAVAYNAPSGLTTSRTYACLVTATAGLGCAATTGWATQCRQVTVLPTATFGTLANANETLCSGGDPSAITFATTPSGGSGSYTYQWYYQDGLITCPTGSSTAGWTIISGSTSNIYDPPTNLTASRTYACLVTATAGLGCTATTGWATQCRQVTITTTPTINYGTLATANESFCNTGDPTNIAFATTPNGGSGSFTYQWYYLDGVITCPTGSSTTGWTIINGATALSYDAPAGLTTSRTYACMVIPTQQQGCVTLPSSWATQCRQVTISTLPPVVYGTLTSATETFCTSGDPANITFATTPSGGSGSFTYQWYYQDGLITCPTGSSTTGWSIISGATANTYDPPTGLTTSRTYACLVTDAGNGTCPATSNWATQCRQVTISTVTYGTLTSSPESICINGDPSNITFATTPSGGGTYTYQWYYRNGTQICPNGTSIAGWVLISGATTASYNPPAGLNQTRTYACMVNVTAGQGCPASNAWASNCRVVTIVPLRTFGTLNPTATRICKGGNPAPITFQTLPVGGTTYAYQWYYKNALIISCPYGSSTAGWISIAGATSSTYDPPAGLTQTRTYACMVTSTGSGQCSNGTGWATNCVKVVVVPPPAFGSLASGNESICSGGNPSAISFSTAPSGYGTITYQWYSKDDVTGNCPTGNSNAGWTAISGATASSYDPPQGLTVSRTYACMVTASGTPCAASQWATNCRKVTIIVCREMEYVDFDEQLPEEPNNFGGTRTEMEGPVLEQNVPNPFTENTSITCILPQPYNSAVIRIVNVLGEELIMKKLTSPGVNKIDVSRGSLSPGIYFYSLYLDGKLYATKRMVITY